MLSYYAEQGDVQMAVSVLIVLGEKIRREIDDLTQVRQQIQIKTHSDYLLTYFLSNILLIMIMSFFRQNQKTCGIVAAVVH